MLLAFVAVIVISVVMHEALRHVGYSSANVTAGPDVRLGDAAEGRD